MKHSLQKQWVLVALLLASLPIGAAPLTITPNSAAPGIATVGIPFAPCAVESVNDLKLVDHTGVEVSTYIEPSLFWPASKCPGTAKVRAAKVQFAYDPALGVRTYNWSIGNRSLAVRNEAPIQEVVSSNAIKAPFKEPAFFVVNDPAYLISTGIIPPTAPVGPNDYDTAWYPASFNKRAALNFSTTTSENWLYDSVSTLYQQAVRTGSLEQYREAYLEHEFWISKMDVTTPNWLGAFKFDSGSLNDWKYVYLTPMKLHLALTGDDSWAPQENGTPLAGATDRTALIQSIVTRAVTTLGIRPYGAANLNQMFTERNAGFALQTLVAAYELTGNAAHLTQLTNAVNSLHAMMTANPDAEGNHGYLSHSWHAHEGWYASYIGSLSAAVTDGTTLAVSNVITNDWNKLAVGTEIIGQPYGLRAKLTALPTLAGSTLTLQLDKPVTMRAGETIASLQPGYRTDRMFSPWMQSIIADGLWQLYQLTSDTAMQGKISELLLGFARATISYGIDGNGLSAALKAQIESAFGVQITNGAANTHCFCNECFI